MAPARLRLGERRWDEIASLGAALDRVGATELGMVVASGQQALVDSDPALAEASRFS